MADEEQHERIVLLNTMTSFSTTRARDHKAPTLGALESLKVIDARRKNKWAFEFIGLDEKALAKEDQSEEDYEKARLKAGIGRDCIRLRAMRFEEIGEFVYATLLVEAIDPHSRTFAVVDQETFEGREIAADNKERGSAAGHLVVRIPKEGVHDDGKYRCAIETVHPITRTEIELLLCRQLRRYARASDLKFTVQVHKGKKIEQKSYDYTPRLELNADVGRQLGVDADEKVLSHIILTKRSEKQIIGKGVAVEQEEFSADVELRISASQGPAKPEERRKWTQRLSDWYRLKDYEVRLYFRHANGRIEGGNVHKAIAGATDLLMCPKAQILLEKPPKKWVATINSDVVSALKELLDRNELWERSK